ncbi:DUF502 domain-containing protein [Oceanithermus sp.]|uniref:DUF502 domain-containing protein n=1 Tax=Oceanithermus sp. TaxID=2268145 RepID=UPI0025CD591A|nr:DUF502 domain-containing protein [Oceanithermus sp.]
MIRRLERYFITGIVVLLPLAVVLYLGVWIWNTSDVFFLSLLRLLGVETPEWLKPLLPVLGLLSTAALILMVGMLAGHWAGRQLLAAFDQLVNLVPLVRDVYNAVKQISTSFFTRPEVHFSRAALVEYPRRGSYALCFVVQRVEDRLKPLPPGHTVVVVPTSPVPASGFVIVVPEEDLIPLDIKVEDALRFIVSAGFLLPGNGGTATGRHEA